MPTPRSLRRVLVLCTSVLAGIGCAPEPVVDERPPCDVVAMGRDWAGPAATFCGTIGLDESREAAIRCALDAQRAGRPYSVGFDYAGYDTITRSVYARSPTGETVQFGVSDSRGLGGREAITYQCPAGVAGAEPNQLPRDAFTCPEWTRERPISCR